MPDTRKPIKVTTGMNRARLVCILITYQLPTGEFLTELLQANRISQHYIVAAERISSTLPSSLQAHESMIRAHLLSSIGGSITYETPDCPLCEEKMRLRVGKFGEFYGCTAFPKCKGLLHLDGTLGRKTKLLLETQILKEQKKKSSSKKLSPRMRAIIGE